VDHAAPSTTFHLTTGNTSTSKQINTGNLQITGQTSGEWVALGTVHLNAKDLLKITISNQPSTNLKITATTVADAILIIPRWQPPL